MKSISRSVRYLKQQFSEYIKASTYNVLAIGAIGTIGHPTYWLWWTYIDPQPNESLFMRIVGVILCALLLLRKFWPASIANFFSSYYFFTVAYTLPFFFTYYLLSSRYATLWAMAEVSMMFFSILILPSFVVWLFNMALGVGCAVLFAQFFTPQFAYIDLHLFFYTYAPVFAFSIFAGLMLSRSNIKGMAILLQERNKNKTLQALAGSIAHEMRNPLGQIKFSLESVENLLPISTMNHQPHVLSTQQLREMYQYVAAGRAAIKRGSQIISMILGEVKSTAIDAANFTYHQAAQITQKAVDEYGYETEGERHKIRIEIKKDFMFEGEETLYIFVLFNLIKNALYYFKQTPSASITITINQPTITVRDTGPGIAKERLPYLFEAFQTVGKQDGTGLGLAYCKRVMKAFGGDIDCHSVEGEYTEFILCFPEVMQSTLDLYEQNVLERVRPLFKNKSLLVVDDDEMLRINTHTIFAPLCARVDQAENGQVALNKLAQTPYDLIIMDLNMPILDGYATAEKIRKGEIGRAQSVVQQSQYETPTQLGERAKIKADGAQKAECTHEYMSISSTAQRRDWAMQPVVQGSHYEDIPIVAYTTESAYMAQVKTQKVGINGFISKPCEPLALIQGVEQALLCPLPMSVSTPPLNGKTVLVVDDSEDNRTILKYYLHNWGVAVVEASDGLEALELLAMNKSYDAILLDLRMPGMSGFAVAQAIRQAKTDYHAMPIIAVSAQTDIASDNEICLAGIDAIIAKPVEAHILYKQLLAQLSKSPVPVSIGPPIQMMNKPVTGILLPALTTSAADLFDMARLAICTARGLFKQGEQCAYIRQSKEWLAILNDSIEQNNFQKMQDALHFLKGSSSNVGALSLRELVGRIEKQTLTGYWPHEDQWFEKIKDCHTRTISALQTYLIMAA